MAKEAQKFSITYFLKTSNRKDEIKQMMLELFKGQSHTLEEWAQIDKEINEKEC